MKDLQFHEQQSQIFYNELPFIINNSFHPTRTPHNDIKLKPFTKFLLFLLTLITLPIMNSLLQRLSRPFTSNTMRFAPESNTGSMAVPEGAEKATLAAGCFWGIEHMYRKDFKNKGLLDARVGYIGGETQSPSYRAVCSGRTGREYTSTLDG